MAWPSQALRRALAEEPTNEEAHVGLMRLYALSGRQGEALRQYDGSRKRSPGAGRGAERLRARSQGGDRGRNVSGALREPTGPPARETAAGDVGKHNLPAPRTSFVGREREMLEVKRAVGDDPAT